MSKVASKTASLLGSRAWFNGGTIYVGHERYPYGTVLVSGGWKVMVTTDHGDYAEVVFLDRLGSTGTVPFGRQAVDRWGPAD